MKFLIALALFLSQVAYADEFYTPTLINRINLLVDTTTKRVLEHPADRYGVTQRVGGH